MVCISISNSGNKVLLDRVTQEVNINTSTKGCKTLPQAAQPKPIM